MNRFEHAIHTARREEGELSIEQSASSGPSRRRAMLGDSVEVTDGYRTWWSYIPHFIGTPGYVYAYAYGQLLALSVYAQYEERGADFVPQYLDLLRAGGSMAPEELGQLVDVDLADPGFWDRGLDIIERRLEETIAAAETSAREAVDDVPRHPVEHRQRRAGTRCGCIARHPDLELVGLWVHSADKAGTRRGRAGRHRADRRDSRPTTSTRCSRSTPTACATPRPPTCGPMDAIARHGAHPRVGQERRVELGRAAGLPAARRARDAHAARGRVRDGGRVVLHVGHRSRLGERPAAARAHRHVRVRRRSCA